MQHNVGITLEYTEEAIDHLAEKGYDPIYGARPLLRVVQNEIENELAEAVLRGRFKEGATVKVGLEGGKIMFE